MADIVINQGTQTAVNTETVGTVETQVVRLDVGSGTATSTFGGTIVAVNSVANLVKGTITKLEGGTLGVVSLLSAGTVSILTAGTVDTIGLVHADSFATVISSGTSTLGTIKAAVAGSAIYVTDLIISAGSATNVEIGNGGTSTPLVGTIQLAANGGLVANFRTPIKTTAGSALVYKQSANIPLSLTVLGYID